MHRKIKTVPLLLWFWGQSNTKDIVVSEKFCLWSPHEYTKNRVFQNVYFVRHKKVPICVTIMVYVCMQQKIKKGAVWTRSYTCVFVKYGLLVAKRSPESLLWL